MILKRFKKEDFFRLLEQEGNGVLKSAMKNVNPEEIEKAQHSYTIFDDDKVLCCGGLAQYWPGRSEAWIVCDRKIGSKFIRVHKLVKRFLDSAPEKRIEASVDVNSRRSHRWMQALGFKVEAINLVGYLPGGGTADLYARVS